MYHDARRVASFISQFHEYGSPTGVKAALEAETTATTTGALGAVGGIPLVGQASGNIAHNKSDKEADKLEKTFDPLWRTAIEFLDYLSTEELIVERAEDARIGQFVKITGHFAIFDMGNMQIAWKNRILKDVAINALSTGMDKNPNHSPKQHKEQVNSVFDFIAQMPHVVQMGVKTSESFFWGILSEPNLVTSSTDFLLKSGGSPGGLWTVIGILDSVPDSPNLQDASVLKELGAFGEIASGLGPVIRAAVGRPASAYGITPLLILREVSGANGRA